MRPTLAQPPLKLGLVDQEHQCPLLVFEIIQVRAVNFRFAAVAVIHFSEFDARKQSLNVSVERRARSGDTEGCRPNWASGVGQLVS